MKQPGPESKLITKLRYAFGLVGVSVQLKERAPDQVESAEMLSIVKVMPEALEVVEGIPGEVKWRYSIIAPTEGEDLGEWGDFSVMFNRLVEVVVNNRLAWHDDKISTIDHPD